jgi:phosphatidylinositol alpha-1,6-mannosyltransferase
MAPAASDKRSILLVTNDLGPRAGGIETFILGLLAELPGEDIVLYTSSQLGDRAFDQELLERLGVVVIRDPSKVLLPTPRVVRGVKKVMAKYQSEVIWFGAAAPLAFMSPALRRAGAKKIVAISHGHEVWWSKVFPFNLAMRRIGNSVDVLTYLGSFTRDAMVQAVGKKVDLVQIAPGISIDHFQPGPKPTDLVAKYDLAGKPTLICVGRLVHRKGQDKLIEALPEIINQVPNVRLLLIGTGPYLKHLQDLVVKHQVKENVIFIGRLTYDELPRHLLLGDVFAMPSRSRFFGLEVEGLGIVYLEASACGIPVIAGNSGGAPDAVKVGHTGYVVDGTNPKEIAEIAIKLLTQPVLAKQLGAHGREWAVAQWSWKIWSRKFADLLAL